MERRPTSWRTPGALVPRELAPYRLPGSSHGCGRRLYMYCGGIGWLAFAPLHVGLQMQSIAAWILALAQSCMAWMP